MRSSRRELVVDAAGGTIVESVSDDGAARASYAGQDAADSRARQPQLPQHRALLGLMRLHPPQDVVEDAHRADDMRTLVEHDALGAVAPSPRR